MYYIFIKDGKTNGCGQARIISEGFLNIPVIKEVYDDFAEHPNKYTYLDGEIVLNPNYEEEEKQKEKERIGNLTCTKRVFALMLQELGIGYFDKVKPLIESNSQAALEWELCGSLERKNPLLDVMAVQLGITPEKLDLLFRYANNEITIEEFKAESEVTDVNQMD
jgi:hypothetical protein